MKLVLPDEAAPPHQFRQQHRLPEQRQQQRATPSPAATQPRMRRGRGSAARWPQPVSMSWRSSASTGAEPAARRATARSSAACSTRHASPSANPRRTGRRAARRKACGRGRVHHVVGERLSGSWRQRRQFAGTGLGGGGVDHAVEALVGERPGSRSPRCAPCRRAAKASRQLHRPVRRAVGDAQVSGGVDSGNSAPRVSRRRPAAGLATAGGQPEMAREVAHWSALSVLGRRGCRPCRRRAC